MINRVVFLSIILSLFTLSSNLYSQANSSNPFYSGTKQNQISKKIPAKNNGFIQYVSAIQKNINKKTSDIINNYRDNKSGNFLLYIAGISFIYGFIHAMTPGHGKNIILGWILASQKAFIKVLFTSVLGMLLHVFNSVIMVYVIWYFIKGKISVQSPLFIKYFSFAACGVLVLLGLKEIKNIFTRSHNSHSHELDSINNTTSIKECLLISAGIGIVPCPVAAILTVFMISAKLYAESLLTALFFASGMTLTLIIYSSTIWLLRSYITGIKNIHFKKAGEILLPITGSVLLMISGLFIILPYVNF